MLSSWRAAACVPLARTITDYESRSGCPPTSAPVCKMVPPDAVILCISSGSDRSAQLARGNGGARCSAVADAPASCSRTRHRASPTNRRHGGLHPRRYSLCRPATGCGRSAQCEFSSAVHPARHLCSVGQRGASRHPFTRSRTTGFTSGHPQGALNARVERLAS